MRKANPDSDHRVPVLRLLRLANNEPDHTAHSAVETQVNQHTLRFGLVGQAILCWGNATYLWESGDMVRQDLSVLLALLLYVCSAGLLFLAALRPIPRRAVWLILLACLLILAGYVQIDTIAEQQIGVRLTTDVWLYSDYAAQLLRLGQNPYTVDLGDAYRIYRAPMDLITPLLDGDYTSQLAYPALHVLLYVPFQWLGLSTTAIYPLFLLMTMGVLFVGSPPAARPMILLPLFLDPRYVLYALGGVSDIVWAGLIVLMIFRWDRRIERGVWFGLACAFKQQPWLLAPFLVIRLWHEHAEHPVAERLRQIAIFGLVSVAVFLVINLPFLLWDYSAWVQGVLEPMSANMIVLGQGLSNLTLLGFVNIPRSVFTLFTFGVLGATLFVYFFYYRHLRELMWILPGVALWFGHRSLTSYWYFFAIPFVFALLRQESWYRPVPVSRLVQPRPDWRPLILLVGGSLIVIVGSLLWLAAQPPELKVEVVGPVEVYGDRAVRLTLHVRNQGNQTLTPRFAVQSWTQQPFYWHIESGSLTLEPGTSDYYTISTDVMQDAFEVSRGAQIIVSDANDYSLRASVFDFGDPTSYYFDPIPNGDFRFWHRGLQSPLFWGTVSDPPQPAPVSLVTVYDYPADVLRLTLAETGSGEWSYVMLDTWLPFPEIPIQVWVKPPVEANHLPDLDVIYGLELLSTSNNHRVWVLFGDHAAHGQIAPDHHYWMIAAPREVWTQQTIEPRQIFAALDLAVSPAENYVRYGLQFPVSMMNFRLLLAAQAGTTLPLTAAFGPVHSEASLPDPAQMVQQTLDHPEQSLTWRGDFNRRVYNYAAAIDYYTAAIVANPQFPAAYYGLGEVKLALEDWTGASNAFQIALYNNYARPAEAQNGIGWAQYHLGNEQAAYLAFQKATDLAITSSSPVDQTAALAEAQAGIGWVMQRAYSCAQALPYFRDALAIDPSQLDAQRGLESCDLQKP